MAFYLGTIFQVLNYYIKNHLVVFDGHFLVALPEKIIEGYDHPHIHVSPCSTRVSMT